jgi:hypothetical protein
VTASFDPHVLSNNSQARAGGRPTRRGDLSPDANEQRSGCGGGWDEFAYTIALVESPTTTVAHVVDGVKRQDQTTQRGMGQDLI